MSRGWLLPLAVAGCAARAPAPPVAEMRAPTPCSIRPMTVTSRDFFSAETRREIRRINRELRERCAG